MARSYKIRWWGHLLIYGDQPVFDMRQNVLAVQLPHGNLRHILFGKTARLNIRRAL